MLHIMYNIRVGADSGPSAFTPMGHTPHTPTIDPSPGALAVAHPDKGRDRGLSPAVTSSQEATTRIVRTPVVWTLAPVLACVLAQLPAWGETMARKVSALAAIPGGLLRDEKNARHASGRLKHVDEPTVRIGDQVERVDERESGFNRAVRGDLGPAPKRERPRFVGKHPLSGALGAMQLYLADVVDGRVAVVRRGDADHAAEIDEVLLGGSPLGGCAAGPLGRELGWGQGATHGRRGESKRPGCRHSRACFHS